MKETKFPKFRAWHVEANIMFSAEELGRDELTLNPDGRGFVNVSSESIQLSEYYSHMIPLQYTGHHDCNGKEIYEGDICVVPLDYGPGGTKAEIVQIHFTKYEGWQLKEWMFKIGVEIIGNIYENHELLEN